MQNHPFQCHTLHTRGTANDGMQLRGQAQVELSAEIPDKSAIPTGETQYAWIIGVLCQTQYAFMQDCVWQRDALKWISEFINLHNQNL